MKLKHKVAGQRVLNAGVLALLAVGLIACGGDKEKKSSQALASVNGEEITVLQLNDELQRAGVQAAQQQAASQQMLTALIDRQLLLEEAKRQKTDRDPKVMQQIERARAQIIAQSYLQTKLSNIGKPTSAEVETFYNKNPQLFSRRQVFELRQLLVQRSDMNDELKQVLNSSKSLEEVATWMSGHKVNFARNQMLRSTADLPPELVNKLLSLPAGQLFVINEPERSMVMTLNDRKDAPVTLAAATPQIEQILYNGKVKDATKAEVDRLRATAKIEYLNKELTAPAAPGAAPAASAASAAASASAAADAAARSTERGVAGLKE